jgi:hypothetical protein
VTHIRTLALAVINKAPGRRRLCSEGLEGEMALNPLVLKRDSLEIAVPVAD